MKKKSTTSKGGIIPLILPEVGMGATVNVGSDAYPATIIQVTRNGERIVLQEDTATRTDSNGASEIQSYTYQPNVEGEIYIATLRKDGVYRVTHAKTRITIGFRRKYYDYCF